MPAHQTFDCCLRFEEVRKRLFSVTSSIPQFNVTSSIPQFNVSFKAQVDPNAASFLLAAAAAKTFPLVELILTKPSRHSIVVDLKGGIKKLQGKIGFFKGMMDHHHQKDIDDVVHLAAEYGVVAVLVVMMPRKIIRPDLLVFEIDDHQMSRLAEHWTVSIDVRPMIISSLSSSSLSSSTRDPIPTTTTAMAVTTTTTTSATADGGAYRVDAKRNETIHDLERFEDGDDKVGLHDGAAEEALERSMSLLSGSRKDDSQFEMSDGTMDVRVLSNTTGDRFSTIPAVSQEGLQHHHPLAQADPNNGHVASLLPNSFQTVVEDGLEVTLAQYQRPSDSITLAQYQWPSNTITGDPFPTPEDLQHHAREHVPSLSNNYQTLVDGGTEIALVQSPLASNTTRSDRFPVPISREGSQHHPLVQDDPRDVTSLPNNYQSVFGDGVEILASGQSPGLASTAGAPSTDGTNVELVSEDKSNAGSFEEPDVDVSSQNHSIQAVDSKKKNESNGWFSYFFSPSFSDILRSKDGWSKSKDYESYRAQSTKVRELSGKGDAERELDDMAGQVVNFLNNTPGTLLHLVFAAQLTLTQRSNDMEILAGEVLRQLSEISRSDTNRPSQFNLDEGAWNPGPTIFQFLNREFRSQAELDSSDDRLVTLFWVWTDCGLFDGDRSVDWNRVRTQVDKGFCQRAQHKLIAALRPGRANLLKLHLCRSLDACRQHLWELRCQRGRLPQINAVCANVLLSWAETHARVYYDNPEKLRVVWTTMNDILKDIRFSSVYRDEKRLRNNFIAKVVWLCSFRKCHSLCMYLPLMEAAAPDHKDYETWMRVVTTSICEALRPTDSSTPLPSMEEVNMLISSDYFKRIPSRAMFDAVSSFSTEMMSKNGGIYEKVVFLGQLHEMFASMPCNPKLNPMFQIFDLLNLAVANEADKTAIWEGCLSAAANFPNIFAVSPALLHEITDLVFTDDDGKYIASNPFRLSKHLSALSSCDPTSPFLSALLGRLSGVVYKSFECITDSARFYSRVLGLSSTPTTFIEIATDCFHRMFQEWCPTNFLDLAHETSETLASVCRCLVNPVVQRETLAANDENALRMEECAGRVRALVTAWRQDFDSDNVTGATLAQISPLCLTKSWQIIAECSSTELPTKTEIMLKCDEFSAILASIIRSLSCEEGSSTTVQDVLKAYNCHLDSSTPMGQIFSRYRCVLDARDDGTPPKSIAELNLALCLMRQDTPCAETFRQNYLTLIRVLAYFLKNSSVLFRNAIALSIKRTVDLDALNDIVAQAKASIRSLFSSETSLELVDEAARVVAEGESSLRQELLVLLGSPELGLTLEEVERFESISLLSSFQVPLKGFANFCEQIQFAFVRCDPLFNELKLVSELLNERKDKPEQILERLFRLLCRKPDDELLFENIREKLHRRLSVLKLAFYLSTNIEVWTFARDMEWIGREGLKRFHEQYANVTNVLLGNTETYEMAVLDSLVIAIPAIAMLGNFIDTNTIETFFEAVDKDEDISRCHVDGDFKDLKQVQRNRSAIQDWFTHGVDEASAVGGVLQAVEATGEYLIVETSKNTEREYSQELVLRYNIEKNDSIQSTSMSGEVLSNFIQSVGLSQNEARDFLEQYRVLSKASNLLFDASAAGYNDAHLESFRCKAGSQALSEAQDLLARAEAKAKKFDSWQRNALKTYPTALLFWIEELRSLHKHVFKTDGDEGWSLDYIRQVTSRLTCTRFSGRDEHLALATALKLSKKDSSIARMGWFYVISKFVEQLRCALANPVQNIAHLDHAGEIVLHTIECDANDMNLATQALIRKIYESRLPVEYEILDCVGNRITSQKLSIFLKRSRMFPGCTFVLLNADDLEGRLMERLLSFLSRREIASAGIRFHCVQSCPTILHTAPWVDGKTWDAKSLDLSTCRFDVDQHTWRKLVAKRGTNVAIVCSEKTGSGKSKYIKDQMANMKADDGDARIASITLHEGTSIHTLTKDLLLCFPPGFKKRAVHFSFMYMPERHKGTLRWLEDVNHFFFSILILGCVHDPSSPISFYIGEGTWQIFVELPCEGVALATEWLWRHIPALAICGSFNKPSSIFAVDQKTRRVCTYLRAYDNGTINRKFNNMPSSKQVMFVLDKSGSMEMEVGSGKSAWAVAKENAVGIFNSHIQPGDTFGVITFDHNTYVSVPFQQVVDDDHKARLRQDLDDIPDDPWGGTAMYGALQHAVSSLLNSKDELESWIVCLTDGETADIDAELRASLSGSPSRLHLVVIGVNLHPTYEAQMRLLCNKYCPNQSTKGFFLATDATLDALNQAFQTVACQIPVSQTFELDGRLSDDDCRFLLTKHAPPCLPKGDMLLLKFWIDFLYRRVRVFDENERFNYNREYEELGSCLLETMLEEVERLLDTYHNRDWLATNHSQLIYDFSSGAPEFRLICTSPETLDEAVRQKLERLKLPGFFIPRKEDLRQRTTLDRFLSQAIGVPLQKVEGVDALRCIDDNEFILTLDFTMKILNIHERVACRIPCIIEGETGVSKTALTKMYAILRNSSLLDKAQASTQVDLLQICHSLRDQGFSIGSATSPLECLDAALQEASDLTIGNETELAAKMHFLIKEKCEMRSALFRPVPREFRVDEDAKTHSATDFLKWFGTAELEPTFFEINVDASLTESDIVSRFDEIRCIARRLLSLDALVVVFLDEVNTSSVLGLFKEVVVDRSLRGEPLEENIVVVAACNPKRTRLVVDFVNERENDLGKNWASGHYQVTTLPNSMEKLKWAFGALSKSQEKDFVFQRLKRMVGIDVNKSTQMVLTEVIANAQQAMRTSAKQNILETLKRSKGRMANTDTESLEADASTRAKSVVSLRDIQRVFSLYKFFSGDFKPISSLARKDRGYQQNAMLLAIAVVYLLRLDSNSRKEFLDQMRTFQTKIGEQLCLQSVLETAMDIVVKETDIPRGIAVTRGLKENIFMTLVCFLSQTPLLIIGPPGSSKTLSVNIVSDNGNGSESSSEFYRRFARLTVIHYQCSKQSTSREIANVFERAIRRQAKVDAKRHLYIVFLDEAGLTEEEKESLKGAHFWLEGPNVRVGFVMISNHVLDAAKSNRCVTLLRQEPDEEEMLSITKGVLFGSDVSRISQVKLGENVMDAVEFSSKLSSTYARLVHDKIDNVNFDWFESYFGLRDYIYFLKSLRMRGSVNTFLFALSFRSFVAAIERNFNGIEHQKLKQICLVFMGNMATGINNLQLTANVLRQVRHPIDVLSEATMTDNAVYDVLERARFKLIIDCTEDDSIMRLLGSMGIVDLSSKSLFMLSQMPEEMKLEQLRLVSGVKFAALKGKLAVLSQTETVNECFYDLFNQHFRTVQGRNGEVLLFANIAVGGVSRRSRVRQEFDCIVHVRGSQLDRLPAPFLNRFEKYRLTTCDVLSGGSRALGNLSSAFMLAREHVSLLVSVLGTKGLFGFVEGQTIDSIFIDMLPRVAQTPSVMNDSSNNQTISFAELLCGFISQVISHQDITEHVDAVLEIALSALPADLANLLRQIWESQAVVDGVIQRCLGSLLTRNPDESQMGKLLEALIQMVMTRIAAFRLIQIATPESVFLRRNELPPDLVSQYFSHEHFSLKKLIGNVEKAAKTSDTRLLVAYTRSDAAINRIPSFSMNAKESLDVVRAVVHDDADVVVVEHLDALRSEARLRSSILTWISDARRTTYLLIIDMGKSGAIDRANFARMYFEQALGPKSGKAVVVLLHFPLSSTSSYPALFLGSWQHFFLDGVGQIECNAGVENLIEFACSSSKLSETLEEPLNELAVQLERVLPQVLFHVGANILLHPDQVTIHCKSHRRDFSVTHSARYDFLLSLMKRRVGDQNIGKILCEKFGKLWLQCGLKSTMKRASDKLLAGTTNLPLSMSVLSSLMEAFDAFLSYQLCEINHSRNLDVILKGNVSQDAEALFGLILRSLPVIPFEELLLRRREGLVPRYRISEGRDTSNFPFFDFVSSCLNEVVESALKDLSQDNTAIVSETGIEGYCRMVLARSGELLLAEVRDQSSLQKRRSASQAVEFVRSLKACNLYLFSSYAAQLIKKITDKTDSKAANEWVQAQVRRFGFDRDLLAVHVICKVLESQLVSVASWATRLGSMFSWPCDFEPPADAQRGQTGFVFFTCLLDHFQRSLTSIDVSRREWTTSFALFFHESGAMLAHRGIQDVTATRRMRALSFFYILVSNGEHADVESNLLRNYYDATRRHFLPSALERLSLFDFVTIADDGHCPDLLHMMLRFFFSTTWMKLTTSFRNDDYVFLLEMIAGGHLKGKYGNKAVPLLEMAFWTFGASSDATVLGFPYDPLQHVANKIAIGAVSDFSGDSRRMSVSHYVPAWLQRFDCLPAQKEAIRCRDSITVFLAASAPSIDCELSRVVFEVMLRRCLEQTNSSTSETVLMKLQQDIEDEAGLTSEELTRLAVKRAATETWDSFKGTPVASIGVMARLICFVAKVAHELARSGKSSALSGTYFETARQLFEGLMANDFLRWDDLFIGTILRLRGEGTLADLLKPGGSLASLEWCRKWANGEAALTENLENKLATAERNLAEAISNEDRKAQDIRFCPHCNREFIVAQENCGNFECGRDAHSNVQILGCGKEFHISTAPHYKANVQLIADLQQRVVEEQDLLRTSLDVARLWNRARQLPLPMLDFLSVKTADVEPILPTAYIYTPNQQEVDEANLFCLLESSTSLVEKLQLLPDLIEFYLWLHSTFKHLVTKEKAFSCAMNNVMERGRLRSRFDMVHADHVERLWGRLKEGWDSLLESMEYKTRWQCEEISIPFKKLEDASLIQLLSECNDPSEGNDFLFLVINEVIENYNTFIRRLSGQAGGDDCLSGASIHPKFVVSGNGWASRICAVPVLSHSELKNLIRSGWDSNADAFNMELMKKLLHQQLFLDEIPPAILNPTTYLRETFIFADGTDMNSACYQPAGSILRSARGDFFANNQDFTLYKDVSQLLEEFSLPDGNGDLILTFLDHFNNFSYVQLRASLEGTRNILLELQREGITSFDGIAEALCKAMNIPKEELEEQGPFLLNHFGFPDFGKSQGQLILSLTDAQLVDFVHFTGHQLATEAYVFASLPLCMSEPLSKSDMDAIMEGLRALHKEDGLTKTDERLEEFVRDVLSFYELAITKKASSSGQHSLRSFLLENNCCDESDAVYALLPRTLTVRNYIALRRLFHQARLEMRFIDESSIANLAEAMESNPAKIFTWFRSEESRNGHVESRSSQDFVFAERLWFEKATNDGELYAGEREENARRVQKWWRRMATKLRNKGVNAVELNDDKSVTSDVSEPLTDLESFSEDEDFSQLPTTEPGINFGSKWKDESLRDGTISRRGRNLSRQQLLYRAVALISLSAVVIQMGLYHTMMPHTLDFRRWFTFHQNKPSQILADKSAIGVREKEELLLLTEEIAVEEPIAGDQPGAGSSSERINPETNKMRRWLNDHKLPQSMGDLLVGMGVREIADVALILDQSPDALKQIPRLDLIKLKLAVMAYRNAPKQV